MLPVFVPLFPVFPTTFLVLPKIISNPCQYYSSLLKLSVSLCLEGFLQIPCPSNPFCLFPVQSICSPNTAWDPPRESFCLHLCCLCAFQESFQSPFKFHLLQEGFHEFSSSQIPSSFSGLCQGLYYPHQIRHFIMAALHYHHHLLTRQSDLNAR